MDDQVVPMAMQVVRIDNPGLLASGDMLARQAEALQVVDEETFQAAGTIRRDLATWLKDAHAFFDPICDSAYKAWKMATERRKSVIEPRETAYKALGEAMGAYEQEVERRRVEAEAAAQRERERLEAEEQARVDAENARLRAEAEERVLQDAIAAEEQGDAQAVEFLLEEPAYVPQVAPRPVFVPPVQIAAPEADGTSFRDNWDFEIVTAAALPRQYLMPDTKKIGGVVRAMKAATNIPGVRVFNRRTAATRG